MKILDQGKEWVTLFKPAGYHVHPPESGAFKVPRDKIVLYLARQALGEWVYPVHRLDAGTSGVLLMALSKEMASFLAGQFQRREVLKIYRAVVRGWVDENGKIEVPLESDSTQQMVEAITEYRKLAQLEIPEAVGRRHAKARYSLVEVEPHTGRFHQIRRHFNRISHPLIGDATHGDSHHNRFFREKMGIAGLCLKAHQLSFIAPEGPRTVESPMDERWEKINALFTNHQA